MPTKRDLQHIERLEFVDANGTLIPAKLPWVVSQSTLDKILKHMQTATGLTVFELCKRTNLSKGPIENALTYYAPCQELVDAHMGVSKRAGVTLPKWATKTTPEEKWPRNWQNADFATHTYGSENIAQGVKAERDIVINAVAGSKRKPNKIGNMIKESFDRTHYNALGLERGKAARSALLDVSKKMETFEIAIRDLKAMQEAQALISQVKETVAETVAAAQEKEPA